jgi:hypothetical protein
MFDHFISILEFLSYFYYLKRVIIVMKNCTKVNEVFPFFFAFLFIQSIKKKIIIIIKQLNLLYPINRNELNDK